MMAVGKINWWGKKPQAQQTTTEPATPGRWGGLEDQTTETGRSIKDFIGTLTGSGRRPQMVCSQGHPVRRGSDTCIYGHFVG